MDQMHFENFLKETDTAFNEKTCTNVINITDCRDIIFSITHLNTSLSTICKDLSDPTLSKEQWCEKVSACESLKSQINSLLQTITHENLSSVKKLYNKRMKKRNRIKSKKRELAEQKKVLEVRRKATSDSIDNCINSKRIELEKEKESTNLRKDADLLLLDVRNKCLDSKKFLSILNELNNLRKFKVTVARSRGENVSAEADEVFKNIFNKLMQQWTALDKEYLLEDKGLNLMIKSDTDCNKLKFTTNVFNNWEKLLFGTKITDSNFANQDVHSFLALRMLWDMHLNNSEGSRIPTGWVLPCKSSNDAWRELLL